jgi:hypothetical protein
VGSVVASEAKWTGRALNKHVEVSICTSFEALARTCWIRGEFRLVWVGKGKGKEVCVADRKAARPATSNQRTIVLLCQHAGGSDAPLLSTHPTTRILVDEGNLGISRSYQWTHLLSAPLVVVGLAALPPPISGSVLRPRVRASPTVPAPTSRRRPGRGRCRSGRPVSASGSVVMRWWWW